MTNTSRVALVRCETYDNTAVKKAVKEGFSLLGGVGRFASPGENILIKPNMLSPDPPEKHVTSHPEVFRALLECMLETGANLRYGDSPGFGRPGFAARRNGLMAVASEMNIPLADFTSDRTVFFPEGNLIKQFNIASGVFDADGIVSLAKLKSHALTRITGAIKNQFGCIPGIQKAEFHARLTDAERFSQMLVDLNLLLRPRLYVMDGIVAMEGNGPRGGDPYPMQVLLFSDDPAALDAAVCRMVHLDPSLVPPLVWAEAWGLGNVQNIEIIGEPLENFSAPDFKVNRSTASTTGKPGFLNGVAKRWIIPRPVIDNQKCTFCGNCVKVCPAQPKAIDFRNGKNTPPTYRYEDCIRCYCCQEMCPHDAITVQVPPLGRLIHRK